MYADLTGQDSGEVGDKVEQFVERLTDDPDRLIGPITSIGLNVAGIAAALVLILITAYYMAVRPGPLVDGWCLVPPSRRAHLPRARPLRAAWIGWLEGVAIDMVLTFVLLFVALTIIGLDFAIFFACSLGAARGRALLRRDRRRHAADPVRAHRLAR